MRSISAKPVLLGLVSLLAGILGWGLATVAEHVWDDHRLLHLIAQIEVKRQQATPPTPPSAP